MKNLKNMFAAATLMTVMVFGTTFANAGIIIARGSDADTKQTTTRPTACEEPQSSFVGIIIAFTGIIIAKTGIIIAKDTPVVNCGIIIA